MKKIKIYIENTLLLAGMGGGVLSMLWRTVELISASEMIEATIGGCMLCIVAIGIRKIGV